MGKKPLVGLFGLVTAGMLVTVGCGECCRKSTRPSADGYKPAPTFPMKNAKSDTVVPIDGPLDKNGSTPPPPKPTEPTPLPGEIKPGTQANVTSTSGAAPMRQEVLSPSQLGFDSPQLTNAGPSRPMHVPARPVLPRQNEASNAAAANGPVSLPPIGPNSALPPGPLAASPSSTAVGAVPPPPMPQPMPPVPTGNLVAPPPMPTDMVPPPLR